IVENQRDMVFTGNIFRRDDREFIPRDRSVSTACGSGRLIKRNIFDAAARDRTPHRDTMQHPVELQIIDVERRAGNFLPAFFARNGFANESHWVRWSSSSLERSGDAVSHIIVGTATHGIVLNLKSLEDITSQNRLLIMDLTAHQRGNDKPISS